MNPSPPPIKAALTSPLGKVQACEIPEGAFLCRYQDGVGFADCYVIEVPGLTTQAAYVEAFYTTPLFKVERALLTHLASKPASDSDARLLAAGTVDRFSAWRVEEQSPTEILLADFTGRTRSWLMAERVDTRVDARVDAQIEKRVDGSSRLYDGSSTRLYFGSAVVPRSRDAAGKGNLGWPFDALLGFHKLYSRLLLGAASRRVRSS